MPIAAATVFIRLSSTCAVRRAMRRVHAVRAATSIVLPLSDVGSSTTVMRGCSGTRGVWVALTRRASPLPRCGGKDFQSGQIVNPGADPASGGWRIAGPHTSPGDSLRIISALLTCILVTSVCSSTASVASTDVDGAAERAQRARISLTASSEYVKKGGIVTLSGRVRGVRGRVKVTIFQKTKGKSSWNVEAIKRTSRKGRFVHREDVRSGDRTYRACVKRACDSVLVKMGKPPAADTAVGISGLSTSAVEAGQAFAVSGVASANLNGRMVEVQAYDGASSSWGAVGRATVQGGSWSAPTAVTTAGRSVPLRAAFLGGVGLRPSTSGATSVTVYGWYYFYDGPLDPVSGGMESQSFVTMNATLYSKSVAMEPYWSIGDNFASAELNLVASCKRFATTLGISDERLGHLSRLQPHDEGRQRHAADQDRDPVRRPETITLTSTNVLRLRFESQSPPVTTAATCVRRRPRPLRLLTQTTDTGRAGLRLVGTLSPARSGSSRRPPRTRRCAAAPTAGRSGARRRT